MPLISRWFDTAPGPTLHVATAGTGARPIAFFHGVGRRGSTFAPLMPWLAENWLVHRPDHRGHGQSDTAPSYLVADYFADAVAWLDRLGEGPVVLYGHSLGALVVALVAANRPDLVSAVILEDPPSPDFLANLHQSPYYSTFEAMRRLAGQTGTDTAVVARQLAESIIRQPDGTTVRLGELRDAVSLRFTASCLHDVDPAVYEPLIERHWLFGIDWWERVSAIRCPALLLHGDVAAGGMLPQSDAAELARRIPDLTAMHLAGAGHVLHWQSTAAVANHLTAFLESL